MKKWMKKASLVAVSVAALTTLVSATTVNADVSRVVYFSIQNNIGCDTTNNYVTYSFNVNNLSSTPAELTVVLYKDDGTEYSVEGLTTGGYSSDFVPSSASSFTLDSRQTKHYAQTFGSGGVSSCSERPAHGKIIVKNDAGLLAASGEVRSLDRTSTPRVIFNDLPVIVNGGQPF